MKVLTLPPVSQERLKEGALNELARANDKIQKLEKENDELGQRATNEQKLKEGALSEVARKNIEISNKPLLDKLQEENKRLILENEKLNKKVDQPEEVVKTLTHSQAPIVKSEAPKVTERENKTENSDLYKKLIAENQRLMKENKQEKLQKLCEQLQKENDRLAKATNDAEKKLDKLEKEKTAKSSKPDASQERLKEGALNELKRAEEKIKSLEEDKKKLSLGIIFWTT